MKRFPLPIPPHLLIFLLVGILVYGCALLPVKDVNKAAMLEQRISEFLEAQNSGDLEKAYSLYSRPYRDQVSFITYVKENSGTPVEMELGAIDHMPGADEAAVTMLGTFVLMGFEIKDFEMPQRWVFNSRQWYVHAEPQESMELLFSNPDQLKPKKK